MPSARYLSAAQIRRQQPAPLSITEPMPQALLRALRDAEDRLTRRAQDERDIEVLTRMRAVINAARAEIGD